ncbi:MAG: hypothetical protein HYT15_00495 [Candidatus Magasanikbacteria bacterium]|nr:hypothetical protein [Candidatus Magasanikbacteria bacterium]
MKSILELLNEFVQEVLAENHCEVELAYIRSHTRRLLMKRAREALPEAVTYLDKSPLPEKVSDYKMTQQHVQKAMAVLIFRLAKEVMPMRRPPADFPNSTWLLNWWQRGDDPRLLSRLMMSPLTDRDAALTRGRAAIIWCLNAS